MRPHERWVRWLRAAEAAGNTGALAAAELALLAVHQVEPRNVGGLGMKVSTDRRKPDVLAALYLRKVGLTVPA